MSENENLNDIAELVVSDEAAEEEARRSRSMNEGFENLMQYEVRLGRGKTTGGEP